MANFHAIHVNDFFWGKFMGPQPKSAAIWSQIVGMCMVISKDNVHGMGMIVGLDLVMGSCLILGLSGYELRSLGWHGTWMHSN